MRVDVVHAGSVPAAAAGHEHRRFRGFMLFVRRRREFSDLKGAHLFAVNGITILGKAHKPAVVIDHTASGPGNAFVAGNDGAGRMRGPGGSWIDGVIQSQRVMLMRRGTSKHPPFPVAKEDGRISVHSGNQVFYQRPSVRESRGAIETHGISAQRFRGHIEIVFPAENVRIRKMKRLLQDDPLIPPSETVAACGAANIALVALIIQDLKKHVPQTIELHHERISDETRMNICYAGGGNYRVGSAGRCIHAQRRRAGIYGNGPYPGAAGVFGTLSYSFGINAFHEEDNFSNLVGFRTYRA